MVQSLLIRGSYCHKSQHLKKTNKCCNKYHQFNRHSNKKKTTKTNQDTNKWWSKLMKLDQMPITRINSKWIYSKKRMDFLICNNKKVKTILREYKIDLWILKKIIRKIHSVISNKVIARFYLLGWGSWTTADIRPTL